MGDLVKSILAKSIQIAEQVIKAADEASIFKQECAELKSKTEKLVSLLRQAARASSDLYERPTRRIIENTDQVLQKAIVLVFKCKGNGLVKRVFAIIPAAEFKKMVSQLENSSGDVSWLLRVSASAGDKDDQYLGMPPIAAHLPILCMIWEIIALLYNGSLDDRSDAAASLVSLARDNDRYGKLIIEEGGVWPLLKLLEDGKLDGQENAAKAIGILGCHPEGVEQMVRIGVCSIFSKMLKESRPEVQAVVAWAVSELAQNYPKSQDLFAQNDSIGLLVGPLLKLVRVGKVEGQENAARAIGLLGRDPESVEQMLRVGVCSVFAKMLKEGPMKVQAVVAWAVSELAEHYPKCQYLFAESNTIRLLVSHLAFETIEEHSKYAIFSKTTSIHAVVLATNSNGVVDVNKVIEDEDRSRILHPLENKQPNQMHNVVANTIALKGQNKFPSQKLNGTILGNNAKTSSRNSIKLNSLTPYHHQSLSGASNKAREIEDPVTKVHMKAMAARALWQLAKGNSDICRNITESRALLCLAVLLEKGPGDVQFNSAMALMEITAVAEQDPELRRSAFRPSSPACKAVVDQLLRIIEEAHPELLIPCVKAIGNLARTFRATETRMISSLVRLLDEREGEVSRAGCIALTKFANSENYLHTDHCKSIISTGGVKRLVQLVYFGEQIDQTSALELLCYIFLDVPDSEEIAQAEVLLTVIEWALEQAFLIKDGKMEYLLQICKLRLELYQSTRSRGYH